MDISGIIRKYGLVKIEKDGKTGVVTSFGKLTAADMDYIRSHKDEILNALAEIANARPVARPLTEAQIAYQKVDAAEAACEATLKAYDRGSASTADAIIARNASFAALTEWQQQYPDEAAEQKREKIVIADPWNI